MVRKTRRNRRFSATTAVALLVGMLAAAALVMAVAAVVVTGSTTSATSITSTTSTTSGTTSATAAEPASAMSCWTSTPNVPGGPDPWGGCFPGPGNVGVPAGTALAEFGSSGGDIDLTRNNDVIEGKILRGFVNVYATNVTIRNSVIHGVVATITDFAPNASVTLDNVVVDAKDTNPPYQFANYFAVSGNNLILSHSEVRGGKGGGSCNHCLVENNWIHAPWIPPGTEYHMSAWRLDQNGALRHNTLSCDFDPAGFSPEAGCSADLTGYGDFQAVVNNTIDRNLFMANPGKLGYCVYGGSGGFPDKPYGNDAQNIVFTDNIWQKGAAGSCGDYGPVTGFDVNVPSNVWTNNKYDDGTTINPEP
jgi:hypothetical protein